MVSDFEYEISNPGYVVSYYGLNPSNKLRQTDEAPSITFPNSLITYAKRAEYVPDSALSLNELNPRVLDVSSWPSFPAYYPGFPPANNYYETLAAAPLPNEYTASGQLLNKYEVALGSLQESINRALRSFDINVWTACLQRHADTTGLIERKKFDFQEITALIDAAQVTAYAPRQAKVLNYILEQAHVLAYILFEKSTCKLRQRIWNKAQLIKRILYQTESRFCGLSWSRRFWFLLHGSHPPKTEAWPLTCQVFGCA